MDIHQSTIQNEESTHSEDDTSPPKKRGKHVSDFNLSEKKCVFDLDLDLPEQKNEIVRWHSRFNFRHYIPEPPEVFEEELLQKQCNSHTSFVLETIHNGLKQVNDDINKADKMLLWVKEDMKNYVSYRDDILLKCEDTFSLYSKKVEELAEKANVDKMIKFLMCGVRSSELIQERSGLTLMDMCRFVTILEIKNSINFDIEAYNEDEENFGLGEMSNVLEANEESMKKFHCLRNAFETAEADVKKRSPKLESEVFGHLNSLVGCLESANLQLRIIRKQLELLYNKNVIRNGYYEMFRHDWSVACTPEYDLFPDDDDDDDDDDDE